MEHVDYLECHHAACIGQPGDQVQPPLVYERQVHPEQPDLLLMTACQSWRDSLCLQCVNNEGKAVYFSVNNNYLDFCKAFDPDSLS